MAYFVLICR